MSAKKTLNTLILSSSFEEIHRIESFLDELQNRADISEQDRERIMLTLSEAVTNAIVHGNGEDPDKQVSIEAYLDDSTLFISVKDEGKGFDPEALPDPLKEENLLKEGGRGVYLIQHYADRMEFSEEGTKLIIGFQIS